jgi:hypothetical protein
MSFRPHATLFAVKRWWDIEVTPIRVSVVASVVTGAVRDVASGERLGNLAGNHMEKEDMGP